jgi:hypothetical protein
MDFNDEGQVNDRLTRRINNRYICLKSEIANEKELGERFNLKNK